MAVIIINHGTIIEVRPFTKVMAKDINSISKMLIKLLNESLTFQLGGNINPIRWTQNTSLGSNTVIFQNGEYITAIADLGDDYGTTHKEVSTFIP